MKKSLQKLTRTGGFSFLEVMIALVLTGIVTAAIFQTYIVQHENYMAQDDITNVQQNCRSSLAEISRHLRMAGYGLPAGVDLVEPSNSNPDTITITYRTDNCQLSLGSDMASASAAMAVDSTLSDLSCFEDGEWAYIYHPDSGGGEWFQISTVDTAGLIVTADDVLSRAYWAGSIVISMNQIKFYIDHSTDQDNPRLMMQLRGGQPQVYAENIADLQFRYRMSTGSVLDQPGLIDQITEVLISVTGQSSSTVEDVRGERRTREFSTSVSLRNNNI